ncbi:hypothetical protein CEXT_27041 [Caerostris extrusa]|uniref:Uncharacterized protein n=1 Tax=Caerostris extrusa TaxID=172846 RepID=A0AAV4SWU0_CAEEX|nr:hypothetical protein CEXT_27041 [Caerostris extrusa]
MQPNGRNSVATRCTLSQWPNDSLRKARASLCFLEKKQNNTPPGYHKTQECRVIDGLQDRVKVKLHYKNPCNVGERVDGIAERRKKKTL